MIDSLENLKLQVWVWHKKWSGIELIHLVKRLKDETAFRLYGFAIDKSYYIKTSARSFSIEKRKVNILDSDIAKYDLMSSFTENTKL